MTSIPLSVPQKEIWTEWLAWSDPQHLNIGGYAELKGAIDLSALQQSLELLVSENEALRLIPNISGYQQLLQSYLPRFEYVDLTNNSSPEKACMDWQQKWISCEFDLRTDVPVRYALLKKAKDEYYLVIQAMHAAMDGWSLSITPRKWADCYQRVLSKSVQLSPNKIDYLQFVKDSNEYLDGRIFQSDEAYWKESFSALPDPLFFERYGQSSNKTGELAKAYISKHHIQSDLGDAISRFAKLNQSTPFQIYIALIAIYFFETQNLSELTIGVPNLNRGGKKYKDTIGMFVSVLPISISYSKEMSFVDLVEQIARRLKKSYRHAKYPLSEQAKRLEVVKSGRDRLFDIIFSYEEFEFSCQFGDAVLSETKQTFNPFSRYPLAISLCNFLDAKDTEMVIESGSNFFSAAESDWFGARLISIAEQLIIENKTVSQLELCAPAELALKVKQYERGVTKLDHETFAQNIINTSLVVPKSVALTSDKIEVNYQQLVIAAALLAEELLKADVKAGDSVVLGLTRGPEVVVAMLACSFMGAVFVPIDLDWPDSRITSIQKQTNCTAVFVNSETERKFNGHLVAIELADLIKQSYPLGDLVKFNQINCETAYTLFTSGTTGQPKGVSVGHLALKNRLNWIVENWGITSSDRSLQATQINFDPSLIEMLVPLMAGGSVAFPKAGRLLPEWLPSLLVKFNATMMAFVPSTLARFIDGLVPNQSLPLRVCCCGGEVLSYEIGQRFGEVTGAQLYNVYGPTEATIFCTSWHVHPQAVQSRNMPVGKAIANTQIVILNERDQVQPFGVTGEVYIAGASLANGYVGNDKETNQKFRHFEPPLLGHATLYKTGDLGWLDCDGVLHFSGRSDRQIKLRGYRIELNEIENAILSVPGVVQAACKLVKGNTSESIHAWYSTKQSIASETVRSQLAQLLPDYMLPQRIMMIDNMPLTDNEKIDYKELPIIHSVEVLKTARDPIGNLETKILELWKKALGNDSLHVNSHFFEAGADSLTAVVALNDIENIVNKKLSLHQLVANPTVASLVECINSELNKPNLLVSLGDTTRTASLYVAASGNGDLLRFKSLANCMNGVSDLHMLQPPGSTKKISIQELAALYADKIASRGSKSIYLAGFSVGGLVAVETARNLRLRGIEVKTVFIVDTILMKMPLIIIWLWQGLAGVLAKLHAARQRTSGSKVLSAIQDRGLLMQVSAMRNHVLAPYDGDTVLIKSSAYRWIHGALLGGWRKVMNGRLKEVEIETSHSHFFEPGKVDQLANVLKREINKKDSD